MLVWLRQLLICLLALAVPLHGVAAAVMGVRPAQAAMTKAIDAKQVDCPHHRAMARQAFDDGQDQSQEQISKQPNKQANGHTCGACSVCGSAGAILPSWPPLQMVDAAATHFSVTVLHIAAVASDGPDRPPRLTLR
jgi:hypothetical protein